MNQESIAPDGAQIGVTKHVTRIAALFQEQREGLERYLRARLGGFPEEAKELAQETYIRLIRRLKQGEVDNWTALLYRIAQNLANNRIEQRKIRGAANALMHGETEDHRTPEISWAEEQTAAAVERAIDELPQRQRTVVNGYRTGQTYERIAQALGVTVRTCRRDLRRAILQIQRKIGLERRT